MGHRGEFFEQVLDEVTGYSVVVEDDGEKAYAYLLDAVREIVSDVWLYNCGPTPQPADWSAPAKLPFQNPAEFASDIAFKPLKSASELLVAWRYPVDLPVEARLFVRGELLAILQTGATPGWSRLAVKDGPLAQRLPL